MALNKFLFTSDEEIDFMTSSLKSASNSLNSASKSSDSFSKKMFDGETNPFTSKTPNIARNVGLVGTGAGLYTAGAFGWLASKATGGAGSLFDTLSQNASKVFFQEMYVNPDKFNISYNIPVTKIETAGGVIIHPWRPELPVIQMSGVVGWIRDESILNSAVNNAAQALVGGQNVGSAFTSAFAPFGGKVNNLGALQRFRENARKLTNSPRKFLQNIRALALSPTYYVPRSTPRIEKFNNKRIIGFTKQYPDGATFEGVFTKFNIDETGKDPETVRYDLEFICFNIKKVQIQERIGQFIAPFYGTAVEAGKVGSNVINNLSGF